jgi:hypothetical protein
MTTRTPRRPNHDNKNTKRAMTVHFSNSFNLKCDYHLVQLTNLFRGHGDRDRMVVGFITTNVPMQSVPITTDVLSSNLYLTI